MAFAYPEPEKGGRGKQTVLKRDGFSKQRLSDARQILGHSRDLALQVFHGTKYFDISLKAADCSFIFHRRCGDAPDIQNSEVHVRQVRFNSADFLKLGVSDAFVIDETNRNLT
jgi:hypothetical protein